MTTKAYNVNKAKIYYFERKIYKMKVAITYNNGQVYQHFGYTKEFKVYSIEDNKIISEEIIYSNGSSHGALADFLADQDIAVLICGGIGGSAKTALDKAGITLYCGVKGDVDVQIADYLEERLNHDPNNLCNHHNHEDGHACSN